jgi:uncharacterized protein DUF1552
MVITKLSLPRRTFLKGVGATLALPMLDAMVSALPKAAAAPVRRLGVVYVPNGMAMADWTPKTVGAGFEMTPILQPLEPFRDQMLVLSGLHGVNGGGAHAGRSTSFLTGVTSADGGTSSKTGEYDLRAGISADQIAAKELGKQTELASLELALESRDVSGSCDVGYACAYTNTISWRSANTPLPMEYNPRVVFEQLFGDTGSTDQRARLARIQENKSVLDSVREKIGALERGLGPADRLRIDEYFEAVRDVERRIQRAEEQSGHELPVVAQPAGIPTAYADHARLMFDMQVLAYQSDLTRIITFMMARELSGRTYPEIGVPDSHHPTSHHREEPELVAKISKINTYHVTLFSEYVRKLKSTPDGDGSLLDHMMLIYGAGMSNSNRHDPSNLPIVLLGSGAGVKAGRHLKYDDSTPMANLLVTLLDRLGVPLDQVGNSNGKVDLAGLSL